MKIKTDVIISIIIMLLVEFASCYKNQNNLEYDKNHIPDKYLINMDRIKQNDNYSCATTSVAMIISYYKQLSEPLNKDYIWELSKTDKERVLRYGNDIMGLNRICDYYDYNYEFKQNMSFDDLHYFISKNIPVVIFINFDRKHTHATVVNGYDSDKKVFYIIDPSVEDEVMPEAFLEKHWSALLSNPKTESHRAGYLIFKKEN